MPKSTNKKRHVCGLDKHNLSLGGKRNVSVMEIILRDGRRFYLLLQFT